MIFFTGLVMSAVMALNQIPAQEIVYGMGLCLFLLILMTWGGFYGYHKKYSSLKSLETGITFSLQGIEPSKDRLEESYQILLELLFESKQKEQNEMEQKSKDLREYFTMWVHQIKTPISAMRLLLQEKSEVTDLAEEMDELFRIEQYVEMALQYTRLDSESTDFLIKTTDLDPVIKGAIHKYARLFIRKKIKLEYSNVDAQVMTDEKWLGFVIEQLLSNAIKYTSAGTISIYMEKENELVIADTGIGIREEDLPRVFEKGYTGYNGRENQHSTGIGLYLCSKIMKKLSHGIRIESEAGKGTRVFITFPEAAPI